MAIRLLSETLINQIAAGEIIERPASVVKELIENALDAGARHINITTAGGGMSLIRVVDDGEGILSSELSLALGRYCTSKLGENIKHITSLGFRGEALASIGAVSRFLLRSRTPLCANGSEILVENGKAGDIQPAPINRGTMAEVRDLFFSTPARLKFMKGERAEATAITDLVKKMAIASPLVRFSLSGTDRSSLEISATEDTPQGYGRRIIQIMGMDFSEHSLPLDVEREGMQLRGYISLPRFTRANALHQHVFVNKRPVRDKLLLASIRTAYADLLPRDRHAVVVLFLALDPGDVDVNVHPTKADVRFRDPSLVRRFILSSVRETLSLGGAKPFSATTTGFMEAFKSPAIFQKPQALSPACVSLREPDAPLHPSGSSLHNASFLYQPLPLTKNAQTNNSEDQHPDPALEPPFPPMLSQLFEMPLGMACAQVHQNYIISQTRDSVIIVDQHAAHERLVYEALKNSLEDSPVFAQTLLSPQVVDLADEEAEKLVCVAPLLERFGLIIEPFGSGAVAVRATPALLGDIDIPGMIHDLADEMKENDTIDTIRNRLHELASRMACYGSVRSGRHLGIQEMNALLRLMESVPSSGTCNHGRPTYIELRLTDIEKLFARR